MGSLLLSAEAAALAKQPPPPPGRVSNPLAWAEDTQRTPEQCGESAGTSASSVLQRGTGVNSDHESIAAGVSILLLPSSEAVTWVQGFAVAGARAAPCREVSAPWHVLLSIDDVGAAQHTKTCGLMVPCAGWDTSGRSRGLAGGLGWN